MKLRARLVVAAIAVTLPLFVALLAFDATARHRVAERVLLELLVDRLGDERAACEASPSTFGASMPPPDRGPRDHGPPPRRDHDRDHDHGPRPGDEPPEPPGHGFEGPRPPVMFAYGDDFKATNPNAPPLDDATIAAVHERGTAVVPFSWGSDQVDVIARAPWASGPCAYVLARGSTSRTWGAVLPDAKVWLLPIALVLAAIVVAASSVVRRIRALTEAVRRSASSDYASPVGAFGRDEIGELAGAFDEAAKKIRSQLDERARREEKLREFLANTTHDVMIPLTVLQGHLASLLERSRAGDADDAKLARSAADEAHYIASLLHNLSIAARLDGVDMKLLMSDVDLGALVARVIARHRTVARERGVAIEMGVPADPVFASADVTLLEQAVSNVVYNAVRYNAKEGHVAVVLERDGARFSIRVVDDGPGIPDDLLAKVTARGARGDEARTRAPEGQGLGLHIAYRAMELHGYELTLARSELGGLEVTLAGEAISPASEERQLTGRR